MHQSFVSTAPPPMGMGGDTVTFTFQSPGTNLALGRHYDSNNPTLSPALHYRKVSQCYNPRTSPKLRGQSKSTCPAS